MKIKTMCNGPINSCAFDSKSKEEVIDFNGNELNIIIEKDDRIILHKDGYKYLIEKKSMEESLEEENSIVKGNDLGCRNSYQFRY